MSSTVQAIAAADAGANPAWKAAALEIVEDAALTNKTFTTDVVWEELSRRGFETPEHRAMGPVMVKAVKMGLCEIETCGECGTQKVIVGSIRPESHGKPTSVYKSLLI